MWHYQGDASLDRQLYRYEITVFHPVTGKVETLLTTDPYSVSLTTNGRFSRFVNLADDDLKPDGWDTSYKWDEVELIAVCYFCEILKFQCPRL